MHHSIRSLTALVLSCLAAAGCGAGAPDDGAGETTAAVTATAAASSYLVSFGGSIPGNAGSVVARAGGTIVARYPAVGAVLARSASASFASALRASTGVDAVGAVG